jgi:hypothetical protein
MKRCRCWGRDEGSVPVIASAAKQSIVAAERKRGLPRCARNDGINSLEETDEQPCVYIVASRRHGTLYTGVTASLPKRAYEHREGLVKGFSAKYGCKVLVW